MGWPPFGPDDRERRTILVRNTSTRVVRVSSHYPFDRVNQRLEFDRQLAVGRSRLAEQADREEFELDVIEEFMPEPLSEEELEEIVDDVIAEVGATSMRDIGRVMADVMPQVAGRADGSAVSQLVREKLA